jgi:hypothetical protein
LGLGFFGLGFGFFLKGFKGVGFFVGFEGFEEHNKLYTSKPLNKQVDLVFPPPPPFFFSCF